MNLLAVMIGGAIGSLGRYLAGKVFAAALFPWTTFWVNLIGCFLIGYLYRKSDSMKLPSNIRLGLGTGVLGGFTTFSTFSLELVHLLQGGHLLLAFAYSLGSLLLGFAACSLGILTARKTSGAKSSMEGAS